MKKFKITAILTVFILGTLSFIFIYNKLWGINLNNKSYKLFVKMDNSSNLSLGTPVLMNGVKVGKVQDIYLKDNEVVIVLLIEKKTRIPIGSAIKISYKGLIGDLLVNIFRSTNQDILKEGDIITGEGPISMNIILEKMNKMAEQLEVITEDISKAGLGKLIGNLEKFSSSINKTYDDIEEILKIVKEKDYTKINDTINNIKSISNIIKNTFEDLSPNDKGSSIKSTMKNLENTTLKISNIFNNSLSIYPEIFTIFNFNKEGDNKKNVNLEVDGSCGLTFWKIHMNKRGIKNWRSGYTFKFFESYGPFILSAGIFEDTVGVGLDIRPIKYLNLTFNTYDFENWKLDLIGKLVLYDLGLKMKYGLKTRQLLMGIEYKL